GFMQAAFDIKSGMRRYIDWNDRVQNLMSQGALEIECLLAVFKNKHFQPGPGVSRCLFLRKQENGPVAITKPGQQPAVQIRLGSRDEIFGNAFVQETGDACRQAAWCLSFGKDHAPKNRAIAHESIQKIRQPRLPVLGVWQVSFP
ncbi:hypothetical protein, partial [Aliishimia ponticola]|uniref:hypothetical protein n=1 Tax=Aliishimia ponticola TaxID=2499833 RepID=UPI001B3B9F47